MDKLLSKDACMEIVENAINDFTYSINKAKNPRKKRIDQAALNFWKSLKSHLQNEKKNSSENDLMKLMLKGCKQLINADHYEHFGARLNDQEMKGLDMIKLALEKMKVKEVSNG